MTSRRRWLAGLGAAGLALPALVLLGCAPDGLLRACTEIGWINTVEIRVEGSGADLVADLKVCVDDTCTDPKGAGPIRSYETFGAAPAEIAVTAFDAAGAELASATLPVSWHPTDAPNGPGCDNASVADRVTLHVP